MSNITPTAAQRALAIALVKPFMKMEQEGRDGESSVETGKEIQQLLAAHDAKKDAQLDLVVKDYEALTRRVENAEAACTKMRAALEFIRDECDWEVGGDHWAHGGDKRIGPACTEALALTLATVGNFPK